MEEGVCRSPNNFLTRISVNFLGFSFHTHFHSYLKPPIPELWRDWHCSVSKAASLSWSHSNHSFIYFLASKIWLLLFSFFLFLKGFALKIISFTATLMELQVGASLMVWLIYNFDINFVFQVVSLSFGFFVC